MVSRSHFDIPICAWLHGSEIPGFFRQKANCIADPAARAAALLAVQARSAFWDSFLRHKPDRFRLVFVSHSAVDLARQDWGDALLDACEHGERDEGGGRRETGDDEGGDVER